MNNVEETQVVASQVPNAATAAAAAAATPATTTTPEALPEPEGCGTNPVEAAAPPPMETQTAPPPVETQTAPPPIETQTAPPATALHAAGMENVGNQEPGAEITSNNPPEKHAHEPAAAETQQAPASWQADAAAAAAAAAATATTTTTTPEATLAPASLAVDTDEAATRQAKLAYVKKARAALNSLQAALQEADENQEMDETVQAQVDDIIRSMPTMEQIPNPVIAPSVKQELCSPKPARTLPPNSPEASAQSLWSQDAQDPNDFLRRRLSFAGAESPMPNPAQQQLAVAAATKSKGVLAKQAPEPLSEPRPPSLSAGNLVFAPPPPKPLAMPQSAMPKQPAEAMPKAASKAFNALGTMPSASAPAAMRLAAKAACEMPSQLTIHKRLARIMEPNAKGDWKVAKEIRDQFKAGGEQKKHILKLFAACNNDPDRTARVFTGYSALI